MKINFQKKKRINALIAVLIVVAAALCTFLGVTIAKYVKRVNVPSAGVSTPHFYFHADSEDATPGITHTNVDYFGTVGVIYLTNYKDSSKVSSFDISYEFYDITGGKLFIGNTEVSSGVTYTLPSGAMTCQAIYIHPSIEGVDAGSKSVSFSVKSTAPYTKTMSFTYNFTFDKKIPTVVYECDGGVTKARVYMNSVSCHIRFGWQNGVYSPFSTSLISAPPELSGDNYTATITGCVAETSYEYVFIGTNATPGAGISFYYYDGAWKLLTV